MRKTQEGKSHDYRDDIVVWTVGLAVEIKLRCRDGLVWTAGLTVEESCVFKFLRHNVDGTFVYKYTECEKVKSFSMLISCDTTLIQVGRLALDGPRRGCYYIKGDVVNYPGGE